MNEQAAAARHHESDVGHLKSTHKINKVQVPSIDTLNKRDRETHRGTLAKVAKDVILNPIMHFMCTGCLF